MRKTCRKMESHGSSIKHTLPRGDALGSCSLQTEIAGHCQQRLFLQAPQVATARAGAEGQKRIAVLGASGYTGEEVVRLLALHPEFEVTALTGESQAGKVRDFRT